MSFARMTSFRQKQKKIRRKKFKAFDYFISFGHFLSATVLQRDNEQKKRKITFLLQKCLITKLSNIAIATSFQRAAKLLFYRLKFFYIYLMKKT
jgi:hypothetical protein